jgi:hypothetical protein
MFPVDHEGGCAAGGLVAFTKISSLPLLAALENRKDSAPFWILGT